jgi:hypothetical protein
MRRSFAEYDTYGWPLDDQPATAGMSQPAQCSHCHRIYDLGTVTVTARYADCSMWKAPCCGLLVDDRGETGWKSFSDYRRLPAAGSGAR